MSVRLSELIKANDVRGIVELFFEKAPDGTPRIRQGYYRETEFWDFKEGLPGHQIDRDRAWARVASDIMAFYNNQGGVLFFGFRNDYTFVGTSDRIDAKRFNDKVRRYIGDKIWIEFSREFIQADQRFLGIAVIPANELGPICAQANAPEDGQGSRRFDAGDYCYREGDQTRIFPPVIAADFFSAKRIPSGNAQYCVDEPNARILRPDWRQFFYREQYCPQVKEALLDDRTYVTSLLGIGGIGKTALAVWAMQESYKRKDFDFFISVSAKDRELTSESIRSIPQTLSTYEELLNQILSVLGFSEAIEEPVASREDLTRGLLLDTKTLLLIDNLETVEDERIIEFLERLPKPVKAIVTSRTNRVQRAAFPIQVGPLSVTEATGYWDMVCRTKGRDNLQRATQAEKVRIVSSASFLPLAIEWIVGRSTGVGDSLAISDQLVGAGARADVLLEFCFRRVYESLTKLERSVLKALCLDEQSQVLEAIAAASGLGLEDVDITLEALRNYSFVDKEYDVKQHCSVYSTMALTRRFVRRDLAKRPGEESQMRENLRRWYLALDVAPQSREQVASSRQGTKNPEYQLIEAGLMHRRKGDYDLAIKWFGKAIERNPNGWRARRELAELYRSQQRQGEALEQYRSLLRFAPARGPDRGLLYREFGILSKRSGRPDAYQEAQRALEEARKETPNDPVLLHSLADCHVKMERFRPAQAILELLVTSENPETRKRTYPLLEICYRRLEELVKLGKLRDQRSRDIQAQ